MNHLKKEKSPYLQQHADNPVNWYPWGEEAFEKARKENKPVFLSIGYATCHWCHVMAHESFEDDSVAELMNRAFVNVKVDREERPDIDNTYMTICQMLTGRGGWPLTIIMTPEKEPFFAATYIPKNSRQKMLGMMDLVPQIEKVWDQEPERIKKSVEKIKEGFGKSLELGKSDQPFNPDSVKKARTALRNRFDEIYGGFGGSPKFPSPHNLLFLLRYGSIESDKKSADMVEKTCRQMRLGGIWDHVGGGFHRYSTDQKWLLPHFEKMLYDQATLLLAYTEAWKETGNELFKSTCYDILEYINEQLTYPEGGFYSAEDADSEGEEGKFYVWESDELKKILSNEDFDLFCDLYHIKEEGNFKDESTHEFTGKNIPHLTQTVEEYAKEKGLNSKEVAGSVQRILKTLKKEREQRIRPQLDDKILTDWNGLMMAALASAGAVFNDQKFSDKAVEIASFLSSNCITPEGKIWHRFKDGDAEIKGMADDYAFTTWGFLELYQTTCNPEYLRTAIDLHSTFTENFRDDEHGGFYFTSTDAEKLLGRQKEIYDGAIPSSNSVAALNAFRLARFTGDTKWEDQSEEVLNAFAKSIDDAPSGYSFALITPLIKEGAPKEVVICGEKVSDEMTQILNYLQTKDRFRVSVLIKTAETKTELEELAPFTKSFPVEEKPAVYICENFTCKTPVHTLKEVKSIFEE